ncbi:hypothetical protein FisN_25Lh061 [Fistulifera solaris]|uniref:Non-specific serine/threonine protein kinase n=1 Tax=Fistulifera solaris TaxID=1519565 RepID=A0A1Z5KAB0_FISSO|nr:hypothetical protein FisN_25Lh061 [Fistulifera solaris]|eukprot:GAX23102.1 hypothetical protein FisN_25Lh061 [Fistulifera solaris]
MTNHHEDAPDAVDQLDFPSKETQQKEEAQNDFDDFTHSASVVAIHKETKQGNMVETTGTIAKHANQDSTEAFEPSVVVVVDSGGTNTENVADIISLDQKMADLKIQETETAASKDARRFVTAKDFDLLKVIGMGAFGKVLQVRHKHTSRILAMKVISKRLLLRKSGYVENIQAERQILTRVRSPFVVTMHCSFQTREKLFIIMDFLAGGELFLRLGREGIFLEKTAAFYLGEIILAIDHLHSLGILHRDLKPENILLGADGHVCVTDFGLAKDFSTVGGFDDEENRALTICGTQEYMAPEMLSGQGYGRSADYWSLGCIAYEMLAGLPPFKSKDGRKELFRKIMSEKVKMPSGSTAEACRLLKGLLNRNVQKRLGAAKSTMFEVGGVAALKNEPFFKHLNWEYLTNKQIEPPQVFSVQDDQDLKHFHQEFTDMALPRSVVLMSKDEFTAHHVESQKFRGFSFIHDSFDLPERPESELESYWKSIEEDAVSVSECASSKMDHEESEQPSTESPTKKRPPRKRKKNKNDASCGSPAAFTCTSPAPSDVRVPAPSKLEEDIAVKQDDCSAKKHTSEPPTQQEQEKFIVPTIPGSNHQRKPILLSVDTSRKAFMSTDEWQHVGETSAKVSRQRSLAKTETANSCQFKTPGAKEVTKTLWQPSNQPQSSTPLPLNRLKQPGTAAWGARSETTPQALKVASPPPSSRPLPSTDWRYHPMPSRKPISVEGQKPLKPSSQPIWPSLGGARDNSASISKNLPPTKPALQGAWASKALR